MSEHALPKIKTLPMVDVDRPAFVFDGDGNTLADDVPFEVKRCGTDGVRIVVKWDISELLNAHVHAACDQEYGSVSYPEPREDALTITLPISGCAPEEKGIK